MKSKEVVPRGNVNGGKVNKEIVNKGNVNIGGGKPGKSKHTKVKSKQTALTRQLQPQHLSTYINTTSQ